MKNIILFQEQFFSLYLIFIAFNFQFRRKMIYYILTTFLLTSKHDATRQSPLPPPFATCYQYQPKEEKRKAHRVDEEVGQQPGPVRGVRKQGSGLALQCAHL